MKDEFLQKVKNDPFIVRFTSTPFKHGNSEMIPHGNQKTELKVVKLREFQKKFECDLPSCYATWDNFTFPKCLNLW